MSEVCACPGDVCGRLVSLTWSSNHAHVCVKPCALSEGLSTCSVCTHMCLLLETVINALYMSMGSLRVCVSCVHLLVCAISVGRGRRGRRVHTCFFGASGCVCACYQSMCRCKGMFGASSRC